MKLCKEICGMPVVQEQTGRKIGKVEKVYLRSDGNGLCGLSLRKQGWLCQRRFAAAQDIACVGEVSVIVRMIRKMPSEKTMLDLLGQRVLSVDGERIGWLTDAGIHEQTGKVARLEVSRGYWDDWLRGREWVDEFTVGQRGIIAAGRALEEDADQEGS